MALYGALNTIRAQIADRARFDAAFDFVEASLRPGSPENVRLATLKPGENVRVEISGGAYALVQAYLTKSRAEGRWETHVAHIDVQAVIEGEELMEVADRARLSVDEDLTPGKDAIFYKPFEQGSALRFGPGTVGVYFPADAHRGSLSLGAPSLVRKVVVKVPV